jgi:chromosome segregation ATPase
MATVRDLLKGLAPKPTPATPAQGIGAGATAAQPPAVSPGDPGELADRMIAERLRRAADQRAAFAQGEIDRLKDRIDQLQSQLEDLASRNLPLGEVKADLKEAQDRLEGAKADRARAHEARQNTDLTASFSQGHTEEQGHQQGPDRGQGTKGTSVRSAIGKTGIGPAVPPVASVKPKL